MKQEFKAIVQDRGRITILQPYLQADNITKGDILTVTIERVDIKKEA